MKKFAFIFIILLNIITMNASAQMIIKGKNRTAQKADNTFIVSIVNKFSIVKDENAGLNFYDFEQ